VTNDPPKPTHEPCGNGHQKPIGGDCGLCRALDDNATSGDSARWTPDKK
jgi:hypothetical protein